jgi:hypothetical protein
MDAQIMRNAFHALIAVAFLSGCSMSQDIGRHSVAYNGTVEQATNAVLVLNVLRARDRMPLYFTAIGAIHGSLTASAALGYDLSAVANNAVLPALFGSTSPSFDIAPLDRQEFARGLIHPIDPGLFRLLSERGLPDQLLIHLLVSHFEDSETGQTVSNDPKLHTELTPEARRACAAQGMAAPPPCDPFQAVVDSMTAGGKLSFNGYTRLIPVGPRLSNAAAATPDLLTALREPGMSLRQDGPGWRLYRAVGQVALCLPGKGQGQHTAFALDGEAPQVSPMSQEGKPCGADEVAEAPSSAGRPAAPGISWYLRSVDELLHYLGEVQRLEEMGIAYRITTREGSPRLFRLSQARPEHASMSVEYRGARWWVGEFDVGHDLTVSVLSLTNQLLNLQKSAGELPSSGTLRLIR